MRIYQSNININRQGCLSRKYEEEYRYEGAEIDNDGQNLLIKDTINLQTIKWHVYHMLINKRACVSN